MQGFICLVPFVEKPKHINSRQAGEEQNQAIKI
jgi:hypothetical protein